jgi:DNA-3-methyladenine glycosylase II
MQHACRHLAGTDPVMARLVARHGCCPVKPSSKSMFHNLSSAIIAQQLSVKAAETIQSRVMQVTSKPLVPGKFLSVDIETLRSAGLSKSKATYIRNLAMAMEGGLSKSALLRMADHEAIAALTTVKGIGQWTAEMYLIFGLGRLDVVSLGDAGLQRAARELYNDGKDADGLLARISENWKPCRSIACWYLWQSLGNG